MAKSLRFKIANMALCSVVVTGTLAQPVSALAQSEEHVITQESMANKNVIATGTTTNGAFDVIIKPEVTTDGALDVEIKPEVKDPWEEMISNAEHKVSIEVLKAGTSTASMSAKYFEKDELPVVIQDGKVYLMLKIDKDDETLKLKDVIKKLEIQRDDEFETLELKNATDESVRYIMTEIEMQDIEEGVRLQATIDIGFTTMVQPLDIRFTSESLAYIKEQLPTVRPDFGVEDGTYAVDIDVLHETLDQASHAALFFEQEALTMEVKNGVASIALRVNKDGMGQKDVITALEQKVGEVFVPLTLEHLDDEAVRYVLTEVTLENVRETINLKTYTNTPVGNKANVLRVRLTEETLQALGVVDKVVPVTMTTAQTDVVGSTKGSITITPQGGSGDYEYTIDGGTSWKHTATFTNLEVGTYNVAVRDAANKDNVSSFASVVIKLKQGTNNGSDLTDGYYSVDISILQEDSDSTSMAAQFFNTTNLPLEVIDGRYYLTVQVLKDGMGMKDVITFLEQRINGSYTELDLNYLEDSSKRYVTAEVVFDSTSEDAYLRCGIAPMAGFNPVLRIRLDENSIKAGMGNINTNLGKIEGTAITAVKAENGKVEITLTQEDETLTAEAFTGKIYLAGDTTGKELKLDHFKMEGNVVTFTYEKIPNGEKEQTAFIGIILNEQETKSNSFMIVQKGKEVLTQVQIKENAKDIAYIKGYEDGTFRPNNQVTKAESMSMLSLLVDAPPLKVHQVATIDVLQMSKDETSIAKQFFKTEGIKIEELNKGYKVYLEIANEGMGFTNIINSVEQKVGTTYNVLPVEKTEDLKKAYVTVEVEDLKTPIILKTGIAPMGNVTPELRIVVDNTSLKEATFESQYTDIDMWAQEVITLFENAGVIGEDQETSFKPNEVITRGEFIKVIAKVGQLVASEESSIFEDIKGHAYETFIIAAHEAGIINGFGDATFRPENTLTRAEAVTIINKLIGHEESAAEDKQNPFSDLKSSHWAYGEIMKVVAGE